MIGMILGKSRLIEVVAFQSYAQKQFADAVSNSAYGIDVVVTPGDERSRNLDRIVPQPDALHHVFAHLRGSKAAAAQVEHVGDSGVPAWLISQLRAAAREERGCLPVVGIGLDQRLEAVHGKTWIAGLG
jgi:hypothetical protein